MNQDETLSKEELASTVTALKKLSPGILPYDIFIQIARLVTTPTIELVPLRMRNGKAQVLLLKRELDNDVWEGKVHIPGTVILSTDKKESFNQGIERIFKNELHIPLTGNAVFIRYVFKRVKRGTEISFIHWTIVDQANTGQFFDVDNLPDNLVDHQREYILKAAEEFKKEIKS